ncbi:MAG: uroporphyrinogen-III synthase [Pseudohongiellaceae bacterium]|jgi:uroporphyrinogen-III synthase
MSAKPTIPSPLNSKIIAIPESRQLDVLADLFERRQANVIRVPLVSILDAPDQVPIAAWLKKFITDPPDTLIVLTGEGLRRLLSAAIREGLEQPFVNALAAVRKICRGPKPGRVLKELGLKADILAVEPTTAGIISTLKTLELKNSKISVQLYGEDPNLVLMQYLSCCELDRCDSVAPYIYASNSDVDKVHALIIQMYQGEIDLIAFTSKSQISRLFSVATKSNLETELKVGLSKTKIGAIGPVVRDELTVHGCDVDVMPSSNYHMKPMLRAVETLYASELVGNKQ